MAQHILSRKISYIVYFILAALGMVQLGIAELDLGIYNTVVAFIIAAVMVGLIILYYMHVRYESRLMLAFAIAGFCWLAILMVITFSDYFTRGWLPAPGELPPLHY